MTRSRSAVPDRARRWTSTTSSSLSATLHGRLRTCALFLDRDMTCSRLRAALSLCSLCLGGLCAHSGRRRMWLARDSDCLGADSAARTRVSWWEC